MLRAENITKTFGKTVALRDVSCTVEPGKITVVIGPSGGGKSTLLRSLALIDAPDSGSVTFDGVTYTFPDQKDNPPPPWPRLTVVFQQLFLWPHLTLRENIMLPARLNLIAGAPDRLQRLIEAFHMRDYVDRFPNQTSVGQRQRAAIARAVILGPSHILLDEVTSALDVESVGAIAVCLRGLRDAGIGVFVITHSLAFAKRSADQVLFLDGGRVLECGEAAMLDAPGTPRLKRFVDLLENVG